MAARKRRWGDRKEGRLLRSLDPFTKFTPFIMAQRNDATNSFQDTFCIDRTEKYIRQKREEGLKGFGMMHIFIASYIRTASQYPAINRFVSGQRIYARNNIEVVLTVKHEMSTESGETTIKAYFEPTDTAEDVYRKMNEKIDEVKGDAEDNGTEKAAAIFGKLPRLLLRFVIGLIKLLDYFGKVPQAMLAVSPFHGSMIITNLGSLGIKPIYHHIYNFGNLPVFIAFGTKRKENELQPDGSIETRRYMDFKVNMDERICDGFYAAKALKLMKRVMSNPWELDHAPETVVEDVD